MERIEMTNLATGETIRISRGQPLPAWALAQMGLDRQSEVGDYLDQVNVEYWYDESGRHLGPDVIGMTIWRD